MELTWKNPQINTRVAFWVKKFLRRKKYNVYSALISQSGNNAPVLTILENEIGDIIWAKAEDGRYNGTLIGAFTADKTFGLISQRPSTSSFAQVNRISADVIQVESVDAEQNPGNDLLTNNSLEIRIYE